jgi:hypothetical protein
MAELPNIKIDLKPTFTGSFGNPAILNVGASRSLARFGQITGAPT